MSGESADKTAKREETKAYLNRVRDMETERQTLMDYRQRTREWLEGAGSDPAQEKVDESRDIHSMDKLLELDEEIESKCRELLAGARNIQEIIQAIPNSRHRTVLMSRFLLGESPQTTAERIHVTERHCYRVMREALDAAETVMREKMSLHVSKDI